MQICPIYTHTYIRTPAKNRISRRFGQFTEDVPCRCRSMTAMTMIGQSKIQRLNYHCTVHNFNTIKLNVIFDRSTQSTFFPRTNKLFKRKNLVNYKNWSRVTSVVFTAATFSFDSNKSEGVVCFPTEQIHGPSEGAKLDLCSYHFWKYAVDWNYAVWKKVVVY